MINGKLLLLLLLLHGLTVYESAAQTIVRGRVTEELTGKPLPKATIRYVGGTATVSSNDNGEFEIGVPSLTGTLMISFTGYVTREVEIDGRTTVSVQLQLDETALDEVVVVGFGVQKKASAVGAITQLKGEELLRTGGATNISAALSGVLPGVTAIASSGEPGRDQATIFIRGRSTWGNSNPFILVDGVERSMNDVDPNEIESISVLKDASATAVFGVKGANGVILITTRRGKAGTPQVSFTSNVGFKLPTYSFEVADQVAARQLYNEANRNEGAWDILYSEQNIDYWRTGSDPYYHPEIDWKELLFRDYALSQQYNLNVSGGGSKIRYFSSLGYMSDGDIFKTEKQPEYDPSFRYRRYNYRSNIDLDATPSTKVSLNLAGDMGFRNRPMSYMGNDPFTSSTVADFYQVMYLTPNYLFPVRYENGVLGTTPIGRWWNPLYNLNYQGSGLERTSKFFSDVIVRQSLDFLAKGLFVQGKVSFNSLYGTRQLIEKDILAIYQAAPGAPEQWFSDANPVTEWVEKPAVIGNESVFDFDRNLYYEGTIQYANTFRKHDVSAMGLFFRRQNNNNASFPSYEEAWVGRATYAYDNKYLTEFNGAYTGSEKFAPGKRFGFFPSLALGWVVTQEDFIKNASSLKFLNNLKFRYSYGEVGSDHGAAPFTYITDYATGAYSIFGADLANTFGPLYYEGQAANVGATWETSIKQNFAVELGLFSKFSITIDWFADQRRGILMNRSNTTPAWFGQGATDANIGETKSHGYEIEAAWTEQLNENFSFFIRPGFSFQENRVINRDDPPNRLDYQQNAGKPITFDTRLLQTGFFNSWDDVYNYAPSIWQNASRQPGDMIYIDYNGDGVVNDNDRVPLYLNSIPLYTYNLNLGFRYKKFDFRANFYGVFDVEKRLTYNLLWEFPTRYVTAWPESVERWTPETAETATRPRMSLAVVQHNRFNSTYGVNDASYLRLKSMEASYDFTMNRARYGASGLQLYVNGNNLFTISPFDRRIDPEGANESSYPIIKRYNLGIRLKF